MGTVLIPIRPEIYEFDDNGYRKQFPISLSWELTAWQAQGLTCRTNVFVVIGQHEKATGLTYMLLVLSCIGKAMISLERLTAEISKWKSLQNRILEDDRFREIGWLQTLEFYQLVILSQLQCGSQQMAEPIVNILANYVLLKYEVYTLLLNMW